MKKSKKIKLVLISAALASCTNSPKQEDWESGHNHTYVRSDSTAPYSRTHRFRSGFSHWYYAFRPYGNYSNGTYQKAGYYSGAIPQSANIGGNYSKSSIIRGGFGSNSFHVSS